MKKTGLLLIAILAGATVFGQALQKKDKAVFKYYNTSYYQNTIMKSIDAYETKTDTPSTKRFKIDLTGMDIPTSVDQFTKFWFQPPISQGNTGTCWCFSTTSFFESEVYRLSKKEVKLSEMYTVYWEYIEKAKGYVKSRGTTEFSEGSEANAVTRIWNTYGIIPEADYNGLLKGQTFYNHAKMFDELDTYMKSVKTANAWNEADVIATVKSILNSYMGEPPTKVTVAGKEMSPQDYLKNELKLVLDDYVDVTSLMQNPYNKTCEYVVPDNWNHNADYYNVSLDDYMSIIKSAIKNGYTLAIGGDVSEAGIDSYANTAVVPSFDIPSTYIDENARQFRFSNGTTTDDHGIHLVGYYVKDGNTWYLIKDSGSGSRNTTVKNKQNFGFWFYSEDFVKLKMMDFMVHKDAMKDVLKKFTK